MSHTPSMLRLCSTKSSWLQGLWKKAASHVSFQMRECACRYFKSSSRGITVTPWMALSLADTSGRAACNGRPCHSSTLRQQAIAHHCSGFGTGL